MAEIVLEQNLEGFANDTEALSEAIVKLQKNLSWLLSHLDSQNVKTLNTNLTQIESEDGATALDGAQIRMRDSAGRLRAVLGKNANGNFVFELYDTSGNTAIHLGNDGNAVFTGSIKSASIEGSTISGGEIHGTNIVGSNVRVAPNAFRDYISLENDGVQDSLKLYYGGVCIGGLRMLDAGGMELFGSKISIGSKSGTVSIAPGASGSFTADGKTVTVKNGVITAIA